MVTFTGLFQGLYNCFWAKKNFAKHNSTKKKQIFCVFYTYKWSVIHVCFFQFMGHSGSGNLPCPSLVTTAAAAVALNSSGNNKASTRPKWSLYTPTTRPPPPPNQQLSHPLQARDYVDRSRGPGVVVERGRRRSRLATQSGSQLQRKGADLAQWPALPTIVRVQDLQPGPAASLSVSPPGYRGRFTWGHSTEGSTWSQKRYCDRYSENMNN